jgi:hypothetical protein
MASPEAQKNENMPVSVTEEKITGNVKEVNTASIALAAAVAGQKPNLWSKNMIQLYCIMGVGYLVSTLNGFGKHSRSFCEEACKLKSWSRQLSHGQYQRHASLPRNLRS